MGRSQSGLGNIDEALKIQNELEKQWEQVANANELPEQMIAMGRGMVFDELSELHHLISVKYAGKAHHDLSQDPWYQRLESDRLALLEKRSRGR